MSQPDQEEAREAPSSLAPVQVERTSDEDDLAGMHGRRGTRIVIAAVVIGAVGFGGLRLLRSMDASEAYSQAVAQLEHSEVEQREAFMRCALPHQQHSLATQAELQSAVEIATERMGKTYAKVLTQCTPLLETFQHSVAAIKAPAAAVPRIQSVSKAANGFAAAWLSLRDFLQSAGEADRAQTAPHIQAITSAWQTYETERNKAQTLLSARL